MIVPKVPAMVEFHPGSADGLCSRKEGQYLAAFVCYVFESGEGKGAKVNLRVFDENGNGYPRTEVHVLNPNEPPVDGSVLFTVGYCRLISCPPVQVKGEAADAAILKAAKDGKMVRVEEPKATKAEEKAAAKAKP